jgi:hypothetical protein
MFYHLFIVFIVIIEFIMKMRENSMEEPKTVGFCCTLIDFTIPDQSYTENGIVSKDATPHSPSP